MTIEESTSATNRKRGRPPGSCNATRAAKKGVSEVANFVWDTDHQRLKTFLRIRLVELASKFINSRDNNASKRAWEAVHSKFAIEYPAARYMEVKTLKEKFRSVKSRYQELKSALEATGNEELSEEDQSFYDFLYPFFTDRQGLSGANLGQAEDNEEASNSESEPSSGPFNITTPSNSLNVTKPLKSPTFGSISSSKRFDMSTAIQGLGADLKEGLLSLGGNEESKEIKEAVTSLKQSSDQNQSILLDISSGINDLNKNIGSLLQILATRAQE